MIIDLKEGVIAFNFPLQTIEQSLFFIWTCYKRHVVPKGEDDQRH